MTRNMVKFLFFLIFSTSLFSMECSKNPNCRNLKIERFSESYMAPFNQELNWFEIYFHDVMNNPEGATPRQKQAEIKLRAMKTDMDSFYRQLEDHHNQERKNKNMAPIDFKREREKTVEETKKNFEIFYNNLSPNEKKSLSSLITIPKEDKNKDTKIQQVAKTKKNISLTDQEVELLKSAWKKINANVKALQIHEEAMGKISNDTYKINSIHDKAHSLFEIISHRYTEIYSDIREPSKP